MNKIERMMSKVRHNMRAKGLLTDTENRAHFLAVASRQMRHILVDFARSRASAKWETDRKAEQTRL